MRFTGFALTAFSLLGSLYVTAGERPNLVIIVSDDMGWNDVGYHGGVAETPHIDSLARDGIELDRFYVHPICTPTRAALMTGRLPVRFGLTGPLGSPADKGIPADERLLPEIFRAEGYETAIVGKWHLGDGEGHHPLDRGFDHFYGHLSGMIDYFEHTHRGQLDWQRNRIPLEEAGYATDLIAAEAERVIEKRDSSRPLFLYVPFNAPHGPHQAPKTLIEKYSELGIRGELAVRAACIDSLDRGIGRILESLERSGLTENTLVLFFCDNGAKASRKRPPDQELGLPLRGGKGELFEGGIRVPAVLRWPYQFPEGRKSEAFISVLDLLPTLSSAVGVALETEKPLDGINRWTALTGDGDVDAPIIVAGGRGSIAVIVDPLKLIRNGEGEGLYDVRSDPIEEYDLSEERSAAFSRMQALLEPYSDLGSRRGKGSGKRKKGKGKSESR
ncbi:MAG: arylsulfatase [Verrucomicrobiota bacterium]